MRIVSGFWAPTVKESHGLIRIIVPYYYTLDFGMRTKDLDTSLK